ncbi:hypothetical protein P171DRAFT_25943 [Karstenula rhodostoma CBS 690.94]|uniref:BTB domain-containing protein n=1 Tax=Karstenula rhodostoma CBS 690.94 TaxID=1392251 RepID=A0A9P4PHN3_9PLEO|nr:hypothetical protein P171DRAFT_25943 [Karstenula rhodostoma CBS 690.94]
MENAKILAPVAERFDFKKVVTLKVGSEKEKFLAFADALSCRSPFFKAALKDCWREGHSDETALPEDHPETVATYLQFLQTGRLPLVPDVSSTDTDDDKFEIQIELVLIELCHLYVFAEKLQNVSTKNAVLRAFLEVHLPCGGKYTLSGPTSVSIIYKGTPSGSPARSMFVDIYKSMAQAMDLGDLNWHKDFLVHLARALLDEVPKPLEIDDYLEKRDQSL